MFCYTNTTYNAGGKLTTQLYDKRNKFNFPLSTPPYTCSNIPISPAYGVYISEMIRYARVCSTYDQFFSWGRLLADKLMVLRFLQSCLVSVFCKFYVMCNKLIHSYNLPLSHVLSSMFHTKG
jgi:hypothetical protein